MVGQAVGVAAVGRERIESAALGRLGHRPAPEVLGVEFHFAEAGGPDPAARLQQRGLRPLLAVVLDHVPRIVDGEEYLAVVPPVLGLVEVMRDRVVDEPQELLRLAREPHAVRRLASELLAPGGFLPVVVAPHERELHLVAVLRLEEALLDRLLLGFLAVVPVVVIEEDVDAGVGGERDLRRHVLRVAAGIVAAEGLEVDLAREPDHRILHERPFGLRPVPLLAEPLHTLRVLVPMRVIDRHHLNVLGGQGDAQQRHQRESDQFLHCRVPTIGRSPSCQRAAGCIRSSRCRPCRQGCGRRPRGPSRPSSRPC